MQNKKVPQERREKIKWHRSKQLGKPRTWAILQDHQVSWSLEKVSKKRQKEYRLKKLNNEIQLILIRS